MLISHHPADLTGQEHPAKLGANLFFKAGIIANMDNASMHTYLRKIQWWGHAPGHLFSTASGQAKIAKIAKKLVSAVRISAGGGKRGPHFCGSEGSITSVCICLDSKDQIKIGNGL